MTAKLFEPLALRSVTLRNRVVISPMCQYSAENGFVTDHHLVHLGRFALGGAGLVFVEATAVLPEGRITHGDTGIWSDEHVPGLARIAAFLKANGAAAGLQIAHAGRKASMQRPWHGNGPMNETDRARGETPWQTFAPSAIPIDEGWLVPAELDAAGMRRVKEGFVAAAERATRVGFDVLEIHSAHGYLLHSFLSPLTNRRSDAYGGSRDKRMRFPLEVAEAVRARWPTDRPLFLRLSAIDAVEGGLEIEDTLAYAAALKRIGIDVIDCSSGGIAGSATASKGVPRGYGFQVGFAERIRRETGIATMAVGLITDPRQAEAIVGNGSADLVAIGREALANPNWPLQAEAALGAAAAHSPFALWPVQAGWWLALRARTLARLGAWQP